MRRGCLLSGRRRSRLPCRWPRAAYYKADGMELPPGSHGRPAAAARVSCSTLRKVAARAGAEESLPCLELRLRPKRRLTADAAPPACRRRRRRRRRSRCAARASCGDWPDLLLGRRRDRSGPLPTPSFDAVWAGETSRVADTSALAGAGWRRVLRSGREACSEHAPRPRRLTMLSLRWGRRAAPTSTSTRALRSPALLQRRTLAAPAWRTSALSASTCARRGGLKTGATAACLGLASAPRIALLAGSARCRQACGPRRLGVGAGARSAVRRARLALCAARCKRFLRPCLWPALSCALAARSAWPRRRSGSRSLLRVARRRSLRRHRLGIEVDRRFQLVHAARGFGWGGRQMSVLAERQPRLRVGGPGRRTARCSVRAREALRLRGSLHGRQREHRLADAGRAKTALWAEASLAVRVAREQRRAPAWEARPSAGLPLFHAASRAHRRLIRRGDCSAQRPRSRSPTGALRRSDSPRSRAPRLGDRVDRSGRRGCEPPGKARRRPAARLGASVARSGPRPRGEPAGAQAARDACVCRAASACQFAMR